MQAKGKLYLLPTPLGDHTNHTIPSYVVDIIHQLSIFIAEKAKTARHFIKSTKHPTAISDLTFFELNKRIDPTEWRQYLNAAKEGKDIGLLSEAGCPGVADPGAEIVKLAHQQGIEVIPLVGPSSILLALMGSGMNGQNFAFHGYLSPKKELLPKDLKRLESNAKKFKQTQIFIETPYRNGQMIEQALKHLSNATQFCIAMDLTLLSQYIATYSVGEWKKKEIPAVHKKPAVFLIY